MNKYVVVNQNCILFIENSNVFNINLNKNTCEYVQIKASKNSDSEKVISMVEMLDSSKLLFSDDLSVKTFQVLDNGKIQNWKNLGYLCPYCLSVCSYKGAMFKDHMSIHYGPALCMSCKVLIIL